MEKTIGMRSYNLKDQILMTTSWGSAIEQLWMYTEDGRSVIIQWCHGIVVAVKKQNTVHTEWSDNFLREGNSNVTEETRMKSKYNKHTEGGWQNGSKLRIDS